MRMLVPEKTVGMVLCGRTSLGLRQAANAHAAGHPGARCCWPMGRNRSDRGWICLSGWRATLDLACRIHIVAAYRQYAVRPLQPGFWRGPAGNIRKRAVEAGSFLPGAMTAFLSLFFRCHSRGALHDCAFLPCRKNYSRGLVPRAADWRHPAGPASTGK